MDDPADMIELWEVDDGHICGDAEGCVKLVSDEEYGRRLTPSKLHRIVRPTSEKCYKIPFHEVGKPQREVCFKLVTISGWRFRCVYDAPTHTWLVKGQPRRVTQ